MTALQQEFKTLAGRCMALHGTTMELQPDGTYKKVLADAAVKEFLTTLCKDSEKPDGTINKEVADKIMAAWTDKTGTLQRELDAARITQVGNFIAAESVFRSAFFRTETLAPDDEPFITNETRNEIRISEASEDGKPETVRVLKAEDKHRVGLYFVTSDIVKYRTLDLYKGDIAAPQKATFDISRDLTFKLDRKHYALLNAAVASGGCFGAFSTEQAKRNRAGRIYMAHSGLVTAHFPTTNDFTNADLLEWDPPKQTEGEDNLTGFRPAVLKKIVSYATRWGKFLPDGAGSLIPTGEIIVPASDIENMAKVLEVENGKPVNTLQQQILDNGYASLNLFNKTWTFIPDNTIASGICFPRFNQVVGPSYEKPNMNGEEVVPNTMEHWETRRQSRCWGAAIISQWRVRAIRINYNA